LANPGATYIGFSSNLRKRLAEHNAGDSIYTNKHKPWKVETYFAFSEIKTAENFEIYLKSNSGKAFLLKRLVSAEFREDRQKYKNGRIK